MKPAWLNQRKFFSFCSTVAIRGFTSSHQIPFQPKQYSRTRWTYHLTLVRMHVRHAMLNMKTQNEPFVTIPVSPVHVILGEKLRIGFTSTFEYFLRPPSTNTAPQPTKYTMHRIEQSAREFISPNNYHFHPKVLYRRAGAPFKFHQGCPETRMNCCLGTDSPPDEMAISPDDPPCSARRTERTHIQSQPHGMRKPDP